MCSDPPDTLFIHSSHSHAAGGAQRGEDCRDDACKDLQECLYAFVLHSRLVFKRLKFHFDFSLAQPFMQA